MNTPPRADTFTPLRTDADVLRRIEQLIEPAARLRQSLWLFFLDGDQQQLPVVAPIDDIPDEPDLELVGNLCFIVSEVLGDSEPEGSVVMVLTRPGPVIPDTADQAWRDSLSAAAAARGARIRMLCLATPEGVARLSGD
jgi:hypothetical protein